MAAKPKVKKNTFLTKKIGPLPLWAWVATAVGTYLAYRYFTGANTASAAQATTPNSTDTSGTTGTPTDTSGSAGGTVTGSTPDTSGYSAYSDILSQLEGQNSSLTSALLAGQSNYTTSGVTGVGGVGESSSGSGVPASTVSSKSPYISGGTQTTIPVSTTNFAQAAVAKTAAGAATGTKLAFGGVTSVKTLKNGATLTTYASGRQVEQAKGRSAYVVRQ